MKGAQDTNPIVLLKTEGTDITYQTSTPDSAMDLLNFVRNLAESKATPSEPNATAGSGGGSAFPNSGSLMGQPPVPMMPSAGTPGAGFSGNPGAPGSGLLPGSAFPNPGAGFSGNPGSGFPGNPGTAFPGTAGYGAPGAPSPTGR